MSEIGRRAIEESADVLGDMLVQMANGEASYDSEDIAAAALSAGLKGLLRHGPSAARIDAAAAAFYDKLHDPAEAERALTQGEGDFVSIAKGALADPAWPQKIAAGVEPIPFDPGMVTPLATLANTANWRQQQAAE